MAATGTGSILHALLDGILRDKQTPAPTMVLELVVDIIGDRGILNRVSHLTVNPSSALDRGYPLWMTEKRKWSGSSCASTSFTLLYNDLEHESSQLNDCDVQHPLHYAVAVGITASVVYTNDQYHWSDDLEMVQTPNCERNQRRLNIFFLASLKREDKVAFCSDDNARRWW
jgi:hypothetical protein